MPRALAGERFCSQLHYQEHSMSTFQADTVNAITQPGHPLIGLASLATQAFRGADLAPVEQQLVARIQTQPDDAAAYMDLATVHFLSHRRDAAMHSQQQAMAMQARYSLASAPREPELRMLVFMGAGGLMDNMPLEFLLEGSAIAMDMHYMQAGDSIPQDLTNYDLLFMAVGESDHNTPLLQQLARQLRDCPVPVINRPEYIMQTTREAAATALQHVAGIDIPMSVRLSRLELGRLAQADQLAGYLPEQGFPIIVRPVASHGGQGLKRLDDAADVASYLCTQQEELFYISRFVNYASADGQFRKYRIVLIEGVPFVCHLAVSSNWLVHYLNADMTGNADKCAEEADCMANFEHGFARRHQQAFAAMHERMGLEYLIIDCAETRDGQLLVFEVDTSAIVHAMDPVSLFPYKRPQMHKIFAAFQHMLARRAAV